MPTLFGPHFVLGGILKIKNKKFTFSNDVDFGKLTDLHLGIIAFIRLIQFD